MGIKGDVRSMPLANVLQDLAMNEQTGTLRIRHKERHVSLWFEKGALRLVGLGPGQGPSPLNGLIALGRIPPEEVPAGPGHPANERTVLKAALKRKLIAPEDLRAGLEHQMGEHLCDAFLWADATFEFQEGDPDDGQFDTDQLDLEPRLPVDATIMEAVRRADEWGETRKAVLSSNEILIGDPQLLPPDTEALTKRIFALLDGERSLREIMEHTRLGQFSVLRAAAQLQKCGAARPLSAADAFQRARSRAGRKEWETALRMARYGLDHERSNTGLLELALQCAEQMEDAPAAAGYARQLAVAQVEHGALEAAIKSYQKVLAHAPNDLTSHERLFDLLIRLDLKLDALAAGEGLAAAYKKGGLPDKALDVFRRLVEVVGSHTELLESVAEIERHLGDKKEAVGTYRKLLARAMEAKDDVGALEYCRAILKIDPRHEEALRLRPQLESGEMERARRRRRAAKLLLAAAVLLAFVAMGGAYEWKARAAYQEVRLGLLDAREARRYPEALRLYDRVLDPYPWSLVAREVRPERDQIEARYAEAETARAAEAGSNGRLTEVIAEFEEAIELVRDSDRRGKMQSRLVGLRNARREAEEEWRRRVGTMSPAEIEKVDRPMAVAALEGCLSSDQSAVRRAAVKALGGIEGSRADEALLKALGDVDRAVVLDAAGSLANRHRHDPATQGFGADRLKWDEWWRRRDRQPGRPPLQASLRAARQSFGPGDPVSVEWRISNLSASEVDLTVNEGADWGLRMTGPAGTTAPQAKPRARRSLKLGPGEHVGGTFDLSAAMGNPGQYQLAWSAGLQWQGKDVRVEASPLILERTR
jgi:tetratricopeptide (TPR) repeat protein